MSLGRVPGEKNAAPIRATGTGAGRDRFSWSKSALRDSRFAAVGGIVVIVPGERRVSFHR
jgi:hypothetical protein